MICMSIEEEVDNCGKIHDVLAEHWNWAYYDTEHSDTSWLLGEYVERLKEDVENRVPVIIKELEEILSEGHKDQFSILDVGCGVGGFLDISLQHLSGMYPDVVFKASGIDISKEMIDYAKKNLNEKDIEVVKGLLKCLRRGRDGMLIGNHPLSIITECNKK